MEISWPSPVSLSELFGWTLTQPYNLNKFSRVIQLHGLTPCYQMVGIKQKPERNPWSDPAVSVLDLWPTGSSSATDNRSDSNSLRRGPGRDKFDGKLGCPQQPYSTLGWALEERFYHFSGFQRLAGFHFLWQRDEDFIICLHVRVPLLFVTVSDAHWLSFYGQLNTLNILAMLVSLNKRKWTKAHQLPYRGLI